MFGYSLSWYIFAFTLLESIIKTHLTVHDGSHGFITNNQRYFDNDLSIIHEEITSGLRSARINDANLKLKFEPSFLDFKHRPLGVPHLEKVTLFNIDKNKSIDMTSISGSTVHFHSSFFEDKKIPPLGNTSFNVVFLGREEGFVESNLFIHTTEGHFKYNVKGSSIFSPYRLRPIVGIKLPINATFSPLIYMHNPHPEPIQIVEVYSSGGDFHLELPTGDLEGPKDIWEIPPLQTKAIIRVRFQAKTEQNHTAYVRIKVNSTEEILVVPLEVQVSSDGGLFHPQGSANFGIGGNLDGVKSVDLCVYNPLKKAVRIYSVATASKAVSVAFENVKLMPNGKEGCVKIATLTLDWSTAYKQREYSGRVTVKYRNGRSKVDIPFYLTVLEGGISYDPSITRYFINDKSKDFSAKSFKIKNNYLTCLRLINVTLPEDAQKYFKIENFKSVILSPQQESTIFIIKSLVHLSDLKVNSYILIRTNVSDITVPLLSYNGKLQTFLPFKSKDYSLDLGLIGFETTKEVFFLVLNTNPVDIVVKNVKSSIPMTNAVVMGCGKSDHNLVLLQVSFQNLTKCSAVKSNEYSIIRLIVETSSAEGQIWGDVQVETQYENLSVPVHFKVAPGKLEIGPDRLVFDQCFPGKICSHPLRVHSTFNEPMIIEEIVSLPPDPRLSSQHSGHILARATKIIGYLYLDPSLACGQECYTGMQHDTAVQWLKTLDMSKAACEFDLNLVNVLYNRYLNFTSNGLKRWQNLTLRLDTSEVRGHIFKTRVKMSWPTLSSETIVTFPLTQIGNYSFREITIRNPSSYKLVVQIVMDNLYPDVELMYEGLPNHFLPQSPEPKKTQHGFFLHDFQKYHIFNHLLNFKIHEETLPTVLESNESFTFCVGFKSEEIGAKTGLIFIRNNLTIVEVLRLNAHGANPAFKFGNRKPGSSQPLTFELTDKHLKDCEKEKQYKNPAPNLSVKRSFTARNIGEVTIFINDFFINDLRCEGYGFRILNCVPFILNPNGTKKIDIAFTPDLTLSKVTRMLILHTSLGYSVNYTLYTTIPSYYLNLCSSLIVRPVWESYLTIWSSFFMVVLLFFICFFTFLDADKIKKQALGAMTTPGLTAEPVLDLRLVGQQTRAELRSKVEEKKPEMKIEKKEEKYTVLVPIVGKSKKKLNKRNSNELSENEAQKKPYEVQKKKVEKTEEKKKEIKEAKKTVPVKKVTKTTIVPVYEEETSSTTTDSSSNNEDIDQRKLKTCNNSNKVVEEPKLVKLESKKSLQLKPLVKKESEVKPFEKKSQRAQRRAANLNKKPSFKNEKKENIQVRVSPPVTSSVWGENRASFSDVVARNEALSVANARPISQTQTTKPTMYVEPYKQTSSELGPIGSRPIVFWHNDSVNESNSFFSNSYDLTQESNFEFGTETWGSPNPVSFTDLLDDSESSFIQSPWNQNLVEGNSGLQSFWDTFYSNNEALAPQTTHQPQTGYLWGSSSVWQPWAPPDVPRTPTRTPPGFDVFAQRKKEEMQPQQREVYTPFGPSTIWNQEEPKSWNYQGQ